MKTKSYAHSKRALDIIFSAVLLMFLWLLMLIVGLLIRITSQGPAIFKQKRVGRDGRIFTCYKFRTMYSYAPSDRPTSSFPDAERYITPIGRFLRRSSLDELPQLWNVLIGDMSLVGPRPLIPREITVHELRKQSGAYSLRPGITGLAQISGRDLLDDEEKASFDAIYASSASPVFDLKIIAKTLGKIFSDKDISGKKDRAGQT